MLYYEGIFLGHPVYVFVYVYTHTFEMDHRLEKKMGGFLGTSRFRNWGHEGDNRGWEKCLGNLEACNPGGSFEFY